MFNKGLDESDKKEGLLKRLKNNECKNKEQLDEIKHQGERLLEAISSYGATNKSQKIEFDSEKNQEAKELVHEVKEISRKNKYKKIVCSHSNATPYDFNKFRDIKQLGNDIFNGYIPIQQANDEQDEMKEEITKLEDYNLTSEKKIKSKEEVLHNAKELFDIRSRVIKAFEDGIFSLHKENLHKENLHEEQTKEEKKEQATPDWIKEGNHTFERIRERVNDYVNEGWHSKVDRKSITMNPVKNYLQNIVSGKFNNGEEARKFYLDNVYGDEQTIKRLDNQTDCNKELIEVYDQVRKFFIPPTVVDMNYVPTYDESDDKTGDEQLDTTDISDLESEESAEHKGQGLKILTPQQMLGRMPIFLAQLKEGNNSQKLKNEIRQLLHS